MKKLILTLGIVMSFFASCNSDYETLKNDSNSRIAVVLSEKNYDSQKLMYLMLSSEDKYKIWNSKLENLIANKKLNEKQLDLLKKLKSNFTINLFDDYKNNNEREIFKNVIVKDFLKKAELTFSYEFIYNNFYTISGRVFDGGSGDPLPNCTCNKGSIYSCAMQVNDCKDSLLCKSTTAGCGFMTYFECNGKCYIQ
ncbi:bacteriocin fulvocin C-related protein [Flavobacterium sp.]|uniref:bacteriocin fulvocin C-related protein n=1 Tax=Flavobacterium sp. TaxID=239 RepID=UPI0037518E3E